MDHLGRLLQKGMTHRVAIASMPIPQREQGTAFMPRFDSQGLVTAVAIDHRTGNC
jgi:hypothetical protein